jgi:hypothetical protein
MVPVRKIIIVSCAGDAKLANDVYEYLSSKKVEGLVLVDAAEIDVEAGDDKAGKKNKVIASLLNSFIKSRADLKDYSVIEFGDSLIIGIELRPEKVGMHSCEFRGYFTPYQEELYTHRMTHIAGFPS